MVTRTHTWLVTVVCAFLALMLPTAALAQSDQSSGQSAVVVPSALTPADCMAQVPSNPLCLHLVRPIET